MSGNLLIFLPTLSLIMSPITAAGLLLPVYIVFVILALSAYRRDFNWEILRIGMIGMTIGFIFGGLTAKFVIEWVVIFLIGIMGFLFSIDQLTKRKSNKTRSQTEINSIKGYFCYSPTDYCKRLHKIWRLITFMSNKVRKIKFHWFLKTYPDQCWLS